MQRSPFIAPEPECGQLLDLSSSRPKEGYGLSERGESNPRMTYWPVRDATWSLTWLLGWADIQTIKSAAGRGGL